MEKTLRNFASNNVVMIIILLEIVVHVCFYLNNSEIAIYHITGWSVFLVFVLSLRSYFKSINND